MKAISSDIEHRRSGTIPINIAVMIPFIRIQCVSESTLHFDNFARKLL